MLPLPSEIVDTIISFNDTTAQEAAAWKIHNAYRAWKKRLQDAADREHWAEIYRARDENRLWRSSQEWKGTD